MSQQRPEDALGNQNIPPSFAPSNKRNKSANSNSLPSFPPRKAHKNSELENEANSAPKIEENKASNNQRVQLAPSFEPRPRRSSQNANQNEVKPIANNPAVGAVTFRKKHRVLKYLSLTLVIILILAGAIGVLSWNWVDSQIKRSNWLTDTPDTQETTWLILGSDQREGEEAKEITGFRTDTILVLTKPVNGHSSLISIPRDSLVSINGQQMKINTVAQDLGNRTLTKTVEKITGHKIDHVAEIKFAGLRNVVNSLGTIDLCYDRTVSDAYSGLNWTAGCHSVDGNVALAFSRMRYADPQSDFGRAARQRMVISAIMKKALSSSTLTNFSTVKGFAKASLDSTILDENSNPGTLLNMGLAFKEATGKDGVTGTVYWTNPDYWVYSVGSSVLLDDAKNIDLFNQLSAGTHAPGSVGTLAEQ
ncbi:LCP family protein [Gardnerella vaginalis]|uniref:LCP family protein n=1 Tax=Gardnerella vaginalis TaxID=2702 RepID=UPI0039EE4D6F